ncbi:hypothetical protein HK098_001944 [Nowakowskiella sp. JEL0407]|nr:hypothetical protein HK098_001944 [Nowakowskiella sp. JEL0407]
MSSIKHSDALVFSEFGSPEKVLRVKKIPIAPLTDQSVLIKFIAAPINPADINQIQGTYPSKPVQIENVGYLAGNEGSAEVVAVGENVKGLNVGDIVIPARSSFGTWRTYASCKPDELLKIETNGISPLAVATLAVNPCTAYRMLKDFIKLEKGDCVIQNGGNSSVGQAVIQLARAFGYKSVNVVRDRPDFEKLEKSLTELGADLVVKENELRKLPDTLKTLGLSAPRLGFNCVGGQSATNIARNLSDDGVMVTYGAMSKEPIALPTSLFIFKDIQAVGFWMTRWYKQQDKLREPGLPKPSIEREAMVNEILELMKQNKFKDAEYTSVKWNEITANYTDVNNDLSDDALAPFKRMSEGFSKKHLFVF